jgi:hypothetical protein
LNLGPGVLGKILGLVLADVSKSVGVSSFTHGDNELFFGKRER